MINRPDLENKLKITFGLDNFYDDQWATIECILKGERVLLIEKTGFGKSLCFQFPATIFKGTTVVFSPSQCTSNSLQSSLLPHRLWRVVFATIKELQYLNQYLSEVTRETRALAASPWNTLFDEDQLGRFLSPLKIYPEEPSFPNVLLERISFTNWFD